MKRSAPLSRKTPLRRTGRLARRTPLAAVAKVRSGFDAAQRWEQDALARGCVMVRDGASYVLDSKRLTISWFGKCRECVVNKGARAIETGLDWSHIFGRGECPRLVFDPDNAIAHCRGCHYRWHLSPVLARGKAVLLLGEEGFARLEARARQRGKSNRVAQHLANAAWLRDHAPDLLREIQAIARQRAARSIVGKGNRA